LGAAPTDILFDEHGNDGATPISELASHLFD